MERISRLVVTTTGPPKRESVMIQTPRLTLAVVRSSSRWTDGCVVLLKEIADGHLFPPCLIIRCSSVECRSFAKISRSSTVSLHCDVSALIPNSTNVSSNFFFVY